MTNKSVAQKTEVVVLVTGGVVPHRQRLGSCHLFIMHTTNVVFLNLHIPPRTPDILQSHRYHHVMPSSSVVFLVEAAASSELIVFFF